jgi:hypothetical protein
MDQPSRREFLKTTGSGSVAILGSGAALTLLTGCPSSTTNTSFSAHQKETLCAAADAIVPGYYYKNTSNGAQDGTGGGTRVTSDSSNGAVQAGAWDCYWDTYYQLNGWIDELAADLDGDADHFYSGWQFKNLSLPARCYVLNQALAGINGYDHWYTPLGSYTPIYRGLLVLTKLAFFGGAINTVGWSYIGYPGAASSYAPLASNPYP